MKRVDISKEILSKLYFEEHKSFNEIAKHLGVGLNTVKKRFKEYELQPRPRGMYKKDIKDRKVTILKCPHCSKDFKRKNCLIEKANLSFCSSRCNVEYYKEHSSLKRMTGKYIECELCGKEHYKPLNILNRGHKNFCSEKCRNIYFSTDNNKGKNNPKYSRVEVNCKNCNKKLYINEHRFKTLKNHFCNMDCMGEYYSQALRGENNPNWRGGYNEKGYGPNWKKVSLLIRERDNFTCQKCGVSLDNLPKKHKLDVHHIVPLREFNGDYNKANVDSNLITLCSTCHMIVENTK